MLLTKERIAEINAAEAAEKKSQRYENEREKIDEKTGESNQNHKEKSDDKNTLFADSFLNLCKVDPNDENGSFGGDAGIFAHKINAF